MDGKNPINSDLPVYNIKAVARLVGLLPVTLRAWERRYGMPSPQRGEQGYRLYSEHDLCTLRWLKRQIDSGFNISRAVEYLQELRRTGIDPAASYLFSTTPALDATSASEALQPIAGEFYQALMQFNENEANDVLRRAFSLNNLDQVLVDIIQPALASIGEAWNRGELPAAVEHYATQYCMQQLMSLMAASAQPTRGSTIVAACAPGELREIGILMLVAVLRWRGWNIRYLGPNLQFDRLEEALYPLHPRMLLFSASSPESARALAGLADVLERFPAPGPMVAVGGKAFDSGERIEDLPAIYLNAGLIESVHRIEELLAGVVPA